MALPRYILLSSATLFLGWALVALGYNMSVTWTIHHNYSKSWDDFFIHFSWLAEWAMIIIAASIALIRNWKSALWMGFALGIQALMVAGIKWAINAKRPIEINPDLVRQIPQLDIHHWQAFPSGHTAVAFFTMGWLAMNYPQHYKYPRVIALSLSLLAVGIGYSRMYLAQHSLIDVCAGGTLALLMLSIASILGKKWKLHE